MHYAPTNSICAAPRSMISLDSTVKKAQWAMPCPPPVVVNGGVVPLEPAAGMLSALLPGRRAL